MPLKPVMKKQKDYRDKLDDNLVLWYRFNEASGTTAYDSSRFFNHGTITGATYAAGKVNEYCLSFDGNDDKVTKIPFNNAKINMTSAGGTVAFWFFIAAEPSNHKYFMSFDGSDRNVIRYYSATKKVNFILLESSGVWKNAYSNVAVEFNKWHHVVCVWTETEHIVYLDGVAGTPTARTASDFDWDKLYVGTREDMGATDFLEGKMDDIRIYNRALSATEVSHLYTSMGGT